ncbi:MAG TPA: SDR family NAD(P)-dependent oxidoreductase [Arenibaculum sp.]|nr:SDR family NAD(P)-dependent oxidoreductase [Arenibaculum sp.]
MEFAKRTVAITGAAGNLGRAVAAAFAGRGAGLVLIDRRRDDLESAYGADDGSRLTLPLDLSDQAATTAAIAAAVDRCGRLDVLCNVAGGFEMGDAVHETSDATWDLMADLNVRTLIHASRAVVPHMIAAGNGRIVNVGAAAAIRGMAGMGAYCATKSAVIRLTEAMSAELREQGINVNCVLPSILDTPQNRAAMPDADPARWVSPDSLAEVIAFLASDAARAIHGAALPVTNLS